MYRVIIMQTTQKNLFNFVRSAYCIMLSVCYNKAIETNKKTKNKEEIKMMNTIILLHNDAILTNTELKKFKKGDLIWGDDQNPEPLKTWSIEDEDDALEELKRHNCSYDDNMIEEWALEYCETNEDGEFIEGSDFKFAKEANIL